MDLQRIELMTELLELASLLLRLLLGRLRLLQRLLDRRALDALLLERRVQVGHLRQDLRPAKQAR